jgi:hypothetical protein
MQMYRTPFFSDNYHILLCWTILLYMLNVKWMGYSNISELTESYYVGQVKERPSIKTKMLLVLAENFV